MAPFYQAFDFFLFPSHFEGMPGTVVEAQAAGLKCLVSDTITKQVKATELVNFLSLEKNAETWAAELIQQSEEMIKANFDLASTNYDVNNQVAFYKELYNVGS